MKKLILSAIVLVFLLFVFSGCTDTQLKSDVEKLKEDVVKLQETVTTMQIMVDSLNLKLHPKQETVPTAGAPTNKTNEPVKIAPPKTK